MGLPAGLTTPEAVTCSRSRLNLPRSTFLFICNLFGERETSSEGGFELKGPSRRDVFQVGLPAGLTAPEAVSCSRSHLSLLTDCDPLPPPFHLQPFRRERHHLREGPTRGSEAPSHCSPASTGRSSCSHSSVSSAIQTSSSRQLGQILVYLWSTEPSVRGGGDSFTPPSLPPFSPFHIH